MQNYITLTLVVILISGFAFLGLIATTALALPPDFLDQTYFLDLLLDLLRIITVQLIG